MACKNSYLSVCVCGERGSKEGGGREGGKKEGKKINKI